MSLLSPHFLFLFLCFFIFFFFNDTATTEIYTLSLHDALPFSRPSSPRRARPSSAGLPGDRDSRSWRGRRRDRKSTRLNSSHITISYAVFCLKKKKTIQQHNRQKDFRHKHTK